MVCTDEDVTTGIVAMEEPDRHARKASPFGSKKQLRSLDEITLLASFRATYICVLLTFVVYYAFDKAASTAGVLNHVFLCCESKTKRKPFAISSKA